MTRPTQQEMNEARELCKRYRQAYDTGQCGIIEGGDGTPVTVSAMSTSITCSDERNASFGCSPGEYALLIEWLPAGLKHDEDGKEAGIDPSLVPHPSNCVTLPRKFEGVTVYYKRGHAIFACGGPHRHSIKK